MLLAPLTMHLTRGSVVSVARTHPGGTGGGPWIMARICPLPVSTTIVNRPI